MPNYVQITESGLVHTVVQMAEPIDVTTTIKEIPEYDQKYLGCLWDGAVFRKLVISCSKEKLSINEVAVVSVRWVDADGNSIDYGEDVELKCGEITEHIAVVNGSGTTTFESAEPGEFELLAISPHGVMASVKVVVS